LSEQKLHQMSQLARAAGELALKSFHLCKPTSAAVSYKNGTSPVTAADLAVDEFLRRELGALIPQAGWLSEESADNAARLDNPLVFIVDPIDGTRAYASGNPCWTISIALVEHHRPVLAVLLAPALGEMFLARAGYGASRNGETINVPPSAHPPRAAGPQPWLERLAELGLTKLPKIPSLAYRLAMVADGTVDLALASPNAHDWDIAAADLLIHEAGGCLTDLKNLKPCYNMPKTTHQALVAAAEPLHNAALIALQKSEPSR